MTEGRDIEVLGAEVVAAETPGFSYDERGLPVFMETDYESAVSEVARLRSLDMTTRLHLAAVLTAVSADRVYGQSSLKEFAADVGMNYQAAWKLVQAYRRIFDLNRNSAQQLVHAIESAAISVTHVNIAASIKDDETFMELMEEAQHDRMTTARFGARVKEVKGPVEEVEAPVAEPARVPGESCPWCEGRGWVPNSTEVLDSVREVYREEIEAEVERRVRTPRQED